MIAIVFVLIFTYCITFLVMYFATFKVKTIQKKYPEKHQFSVLIPFRNEGENVKKLLQSISKLNYIFSNFEVILIDDNDIEQLFDLSKFDFKIQKITNKRTTNSPKKDALTLGIKKAQFSWIITVDADCEVPVNWLQNYNNYLIENPEKELVIGEVKMQSNGSVLQIFQTIEFDVLQAITKGSFAIQKSFMCNGANLCFSQKIFHQVNGYQGNTDISSGDDVFLLQKINSLSPKFIGYCNHHEKVTTKAENNWIRMWNQRVRWASKTKAYQSFFAKYLAFLVFFTHFSANFGLFYLILIHFDSLLFCLLILKYLTHLILLFNVRKFNFKTLIFSVIFEIYYSFFTILIAFKTLFNSKINWK